jgi:carbon monoxide dehydrogenase subunit G
MGGPDDGAGTSLMKIEKSFELQHPREFVWSRMNDVYFVAQCLPGAAIVEDLGDHRYKGRMSVKVGPMAAAFDGEIGIESQPQAWTAIVSGKGADARSSSRATGTMTYQLGEGRSPGATRVDVTSDINLAGPLAQFGKGAVMQEVAGRITAEFVKNFETALSASPDAGKAGPSEPSASSQSLDAGNLLWSILRERFLALFRKRPL